MCNIKTKVCNNCGQEKPLTSEYFYKDKRYKDGLINQCKVCCKEKSKKYRKENSEKISERQKKWTEKNKQYIKEYYSEWYKENRDRKIKQVYLNDRKKYHNDTFYKMKKIIRSRIADKIKYKSMKSSDILGCDWETFKKHLESQFQEGMTWDNHGINGWHYDHIIPISSAKTEEELIKLNHYTNFQPLWAQDNIRKSDKISEELKNA